MDRIKRLITDAMHLLYGIGIIYVYQFYLSIAVLMCFGFVAYQSIQKENRSDKVGDLVELIIGIILGYLIWIE